METPKRYGRPDPEILDTTPIEMPLGARQPTPIHVLIARMVRQAVEVEKNTEMETFEEANDFAEEDEATLDLTPYTLTDMEPEEYVDPFDEPAALGDKPKAAQPTGDPPDQNGEDAGEP